MSNTASSFIQFTFLSQTASANVAAALRSFLMGERYDSPVSRVRTLALIPLEPKRPAHAEVSVRHRTDSLPIRDYIDELAHFGERKMSLGTILLIVVVLLLLGVIPRWQHSRRWGYAPSGVVGAVLIVLVVLVLMGRF
jgi:Protein of unknown function (DUF3309)